MIFRGSEKSQIGYESTLNASFLSEDSSPLDRKRLFKEPGYPKAQLCQVAMLMVPFGGPRSLTVIMGKMMYEREHI